MQTDFRKILETLVEHECEFIVVGALSAVLQGAPLMTVDVDIVHLRTPQNLKKLHSALEVLESKYRGHPGEIRPTEELLDSDGHQLLSTNYGPLDVLGTIEHALDFAALMPDVLEKSWKGSKLLILSLEKYVELKTESVFAKDKSRLPVLMEALRLSQESDN